jgi:methylmalonyl-CoA mutase cobalamin-binding subunit
MNGARFADVAAIQERVTAVLPSIPKEAFADSFQKVYERCQQCVVKEVNLFVSSVLFVFWYHSPNFLDTPRKLHCT